MVSTDDCRTTASAVPVSGGTGAGPNSLAGVRLQLHTAGEPTPDRFVLNELPGGTKAALE
jgi:hypothetical protein